MTTYAAIALATLWSVTFGYEPSADADVGYDYIVQIEPEMLEAMERGEAPAIEANLPPEVTPVRRVRIVVGKAELPKKLRAPVGHTAMRPDIDADSAATLLAQTGPAGVYGRTPTGFQNPPAGTPSTAATASTVPPATTVPPPETRYQPFQYANPPGGVPGVANSTTGYPAAPTQPGVGNPLDQGHDNWAAATTPAAGVANGVPPAVTSQPNYVPTDYRNDPRYAQEQSVLNQGQGGAASGNMNIQPPPLEPPSVNTGGGQYAPTQHRNPVDLNTWATTRDNPTAAQPNNQGNNPPLGYESGTPNVHGQLPPVVSLPAGNAWQGNAGNMANQGTPNPAAGVTTVSHPPESGLPEVNSGQQNNPSPNSGGRSNDLTEFGTGGNTIDHGQSREANGTTVAGSGGATLLNVMAWIIAAGAVAGNLFQWVSIVDLRNRYRVALRRNSPGFGRSMAA